MKLHEYQAKDILRKRGVLTLDSQVCFTLEEARQAITDIGCPCVIKAQVHAGGRGKAGGIKVAQDAKEAIKLAEEILGLTIKTEQTGENGLRVSCILVEKAANIKEELYVSFVVDREYAQICLIASCAGGVDIEETAQKHPEKIFKTYIDPVIGIMPYQVRELALKLNLKNSVKKNFVSLLCSAYRAFIECDASLVEINPLAITQNDKVIALDARMALDESALFRQRSLGEMRDPSQEDEKEIEAQHHGLSYVALDGSIGCMVNGAGLAMATMDIIKHVGGSPANFLDVGGSATKERVSEALKIIIRDPKVKAIFINVFGGIAKCDVIAQGVIDAVADFGLNMPLIVRLQGTNVEMGREILKNSGLSIIPAADMLQGAKLAVQHAAKKEG